MTLAAKTLLTILVASLAAILFAANAAGGRDAARDPLRQGAQTEAKERVYIGQQDAIRAGEKLFRQHCVECHGANARGIGKAANLRSGRIRAKSPEELVEFLRNGNLWKGMPSWSGLSEQRRWQIVAYLKSLH